jgi:hypothetical protein
MELQNNQKSCEVEVLGTTQKHFILQEGDIFVSS